MSNYLQRRDETRPAAHGERAIEGGRPQRGRRPVCGMLLDSPTALEYEYQSYRYHFCREQFRAAPGYFLRAVARV